MFVSTIGEWKAAGAKAGPSPTPPDDPTRDARALAERYEALAKKIDDLGLASPELLPRATRYQQLSREAARALRDVAQAVASGDAATARRRRVEFDDIARGEGPLVADINTVCR